MAKRLNRADGHLRSIIGVIEVPRPYVDIAQQSPAVESAIASAKRALIDDHIDHCLVYAGDDEPQPAIDQFRAISKYWLRGVASGSPRSIEDPAPFPPRGMSRSPASADRFGSARHLQP